MRRYLIEGLGGVVWMVAFGGTVASMVMVLAGPLALHLSWWLTPLWLAMAVVCIATITKLSDMAWNN
jgi:hypothetical protein